MLVFREAHTQAPHGAHGILLAEWWQTYIDPCWPKWALVGPNMWSPRGNLLQVPMDHIICNPCVAHVIDPHWPFIGLIGFCYLGLCVGPIRGPHVATRCKSPWAPAVATHVWPMRMHRTGHSWNPWDFVIWEICQ